MEIPIPRQPGGLAFALALVAVLVPARAYPQDHIVFIVDSQGRGVYVNAVSPDAGAAGPAAWVNPTTSFPASSDLRRLAGKTARAFQVDPGLVDAVIQVESGYNARARSPKGALGLMQLIPATASRFGVSNPFDPADNLRGGVTYLGHLLTLFGGNVPLSLAAYNAGEGAVVRQGGIPPFAETRDYVRKVAAVYPAAAGWRKPVAGHGSALARSDEDSAHAGSNPASPAPIYRFVDEQGVTHFAQ
jgi:soluble lytic murein transglycosylase-like protein